MMLGFDADDDFVQSRAQYPLACRRCCGRMRPGEIKVGTELHQVLPLLLAQKWRLPRLERGDLALDRCTP